MLKAIALVGIFALGGLLGSKAAGRLERRLNSLRELIASVNAIRDRAAYSRVPLTALMASLPTRQTLWRSYARAVSETRMPEEAWKRARQEAEAPGPNQLLLTKEDWDVLEGFAVSLGKLDAHAQIRSCQSVTSALERQKAEAEAACVGRGRIYRLLGFSGGAALAILLI